MDIKLLHSNPEQTEQTCTVSSITCQTRSRAIHSQPWEISHNPFYLQEMKSSITVTNVKLQCGRLDSGSGVCIPIGIRITLFYLLSYFDWLIAHLTSQIKSSRTAGGHFPKETCTVLIQLLPVLGVTNRIRHADLLCWLFLTCMLVLGQDASRRTISVQVSCHKGLRLF